jgi:DNA polymerase-3 subunit gamma/tau
VAATRWNLKYRPKQFKDVLGQKHIIDFFEIVLGEYYKNQRPLPAGALFGGSSGVGKTTVARVVAASLNCDKRTGVEPCGTCESCYQITQGLGGVMELDAAFCGLVDNIRELGDRLVSYSFAEYQIVILDECHMMSKEALNALLKLLEEPPENVFFILITTDVSEIVKKSEAVVSRLLEFRFKLIQWLEIEKFLTMLLDKESTNCSMELCRELYELSGRNLREVLVKLENLSILGKGVVTRELVKEAYGDVTVVKEIIMQLKTGDFVKAVELFDEFQVFQPDFKIFIRRFVDYLGSLLKQALKAGTRDSLLYGAMLKCTYGFISNRIVSQGKPAAKLLFHEIASSVGGLSKSSTKSQPLKGEEVIQLLTSE